jgi:hypothetical protein
MAYHDFARDAGLLDLVREGNHVGVEDLARTDVYAYVVQARDVAVQGAQPPVHLLGVVSPGVAVGVFAEAVHAMEEVLASHTLDEVEIDEYGPVDWNAIVAEE